MTETARVERWLNALRLMRIPFSVFLMPVFWFALLNMSADVNKASLVFIVLHLFVYPASNGYNSYFDRDEQSIGGLKNPPATTKELWFLVIFFDIMAVLCALLINLPFAAMILVYLLASKAYSWDKIRLKKYPVVGAFIVVFFQGFFTYLTVQVGAATTDIFTTTNLLMASISSLFLLGSYPMTQIYQHEEDAKHGDKTLSMLLGINGTFVFSALIFFIASALIVILFLLNGRIDFCLIYLTALIPVNIYFINWYRNFRNGKPVITYEKTMKLNGFSSLLLSSAFILMLVLK